MNEYENESFFNKIINVHYDLFFNFYIKLNFSKFIILLCSICQILQFQSFFFHINVKYFIFNYFNLNSIIKIGITIINFFLTFQNFLLIFE